MGKLSGEPGMVQATSGIREGGMQVFALQVGHLGKDVVGAQPGGKQVQHVGDADAHAADTRTPGALPQVDGDTIVCVRHKHSCIGHNNQYGTKANTEGIKLSARAAVPLGSVDVDFLNVGVAQLFPGVYVFNARAERVNVGTAHSIADFAKPNSTVGEIKLGAPCKSLVCLPITSVSPSAKGKKHMSTQSFLPTNDDKFAAWLQNYVTVAGNNELQLGLTGYDLAADNNALSTLVQSINDAKTARAAAKAAVKAQSASRARAAATIRAQAKRIQAQDNVPNSLLLALGLSVHQKPGTPGTVAPVRPATVSAQPHASGTNTVNWKASGNKPGTIYVVQALMPTPGVKVPFADGAPAVPDNAWNYVTSVSATRFAHNDCTPGQTMYYRVIAQRGIKASVPSEAVVVYGP